jgi:hypothetical protein
MNFLRIPIRQLKTRALDLHYDPMPLPKVCATSGSFADADRIFLEEVARIAGASVERHSEPATLSKELALWSRLRMEPTEPRCFANHMAVHCLQQVLTRGIGGEIELAVQRIELEYVVMKWTLTGSGAKVGRRIAAHCIDTRAIPRTVGKIACPKSLRQALGRAGNVEQRPVKCVGCRFVRGVLDVVKNHGVGLQALGSGAGICTQVPVELKCG